MVHEKLLVFDKKDRQILYELDKDCRKTNAEIGRKVKLSKQAVKNRIVQLQKKEYLIRFASVIDTYKLGWYKFKVYLSFKDANKEILIQITKHLMEAPNSEWVATCSGKWDLIVGFIVRTPYTFHKIFQDFEEKYSNYIQSRELTISLGVPHWHKEYLVDSKGPFECHFQGGDIGNYKLSLLDEKIIKLLVNNARMSAVEIARRLNVSPRVVSYRIKKLKADKVIVLQHLFLNFPKLSFIFCKALIKFKNLSRKKYDSFFRACSDIPNLTFLINCIGSWDAELDFEVPDFNVFHDIMLNLRDRFSDIIASYDFAIVLKEEKLDSYPGANPQL